MQDNIEQGTKTQQIFVEHHRTRNKPQQILAEQHEVGKNITDIYRTTHKCRKRNKTQQTFVEQQGTKNKTQINLI